MFGLETQEYMDNADNMAIYDINTIVNYDSEIIKIIENPTGSQFEKNNSGNFIEIKNKTHNKRIKPFATLTGTFKSDAPHALLKAPYFYRSHYTIYLNQLST